MYNHPTSRITSLLIVMAGLPFLSPASASLVAAMVLGFYFVHPDLRLVRLAKALLRLKWLFLTLVVLYFWFTPGEPVIEIRSVFVPTKQGVMLGIVRLLIMATMIALVYATLWLTPAAQVQLAILDLSAILRLPAVFSRRLAVRLTACMETVPLILEEFNKGLQTGDSKASRNGAPIRKLVYVLEKVESLEFEPPVSAAPNTRQFGRTFTPAMMLLPLVSAVTVIGLLRFPG